MWLSLVERYVRDVEVAGSNPVTSTNYNAGFDTMYHDRRLFYLRCMMITKNQYLANPCKISSIPYWKTKTVIPSEGIKIVHDDNFDKSKYSQYSDEIYFRLFHNMEHIPLPQLPEGFLLSDISLKEYVDHINSCYHDIGISESELYAYTTRPVFHEKLWIAVRDRTNDLIVASGIAELDHEIGEGMLEWIQVSERYRGRGLGRFLVCELLWRMKDLASFTTVSGQCDNPTDPQRLYRKCGFTGTDVWHILRK